jgi:hypothetical protein
MGESGGCEWGIFAEYASVHFRRASRPVIGPQRRSRCLRELLRQSAALLWKLYGLGGGLGTLFADGVYQTVYIELRHMPDLCRLAPSKVTMELPHDCGAPNCCIANMYDGLDHAPAQFKSVSSQCSCRRHSMSTLVLVRRIENWSLPVITPRFSATP